jgi:hypothetical protein
MNQKNKIDTFGGKIVQTTIYLDDFDIYQLNNGFSVKKQDILITFAEGSKRYKEVKE